jgi:hypothetical protein
MKVLVGRKEPKLREFYNLMRTSPKYKIWSTAEELRSVRPSGEENKTICHFFLNVCPWSLSFLKYFLSNIK